jgi:TATA-binding protein-associated factor
MKDLQAMDRAHRLGQKRVVQVYRLITKDTLEEKIMGLQKFKLNIASSVVNTENTGLLTMSTGAILDLLHEDMGATVAKGARKDADEHGGKMTLGKMLEELEWAEHATDGAEDMGIREFLDAL